MQRKVLTTKCYRQIPVCVCSWEGGGGGGICVTFVLPLWPRELCRFEFLALHSILVSTLALGYDGDTSKSKKIGIQCFWKFGCPITYCITVPNMLDRLFSEFPKEK